MKVTSRFIVALAILASALGFAKVSHCEGTKWTTPDQYIHACYSDIPALFTDRGLNTGAWAYSSTTNAVEYPVITGLVMWLQAKLVPAGGDGLDYFNINLFFLISLFISSAWIVYKIAPQFSYLYVLAPAAIASMYINWDLWAIVSMLAAIYYFDRNKYDYSAIALGISISTKFMPIFLALPIAFILWRKNEIKSLIRFGAITIATFLVINLPVALTTPEGWWHFYKLNIDRGPDWGSIWYALNSLGFGLANLNFLMTMTLLLGITAFILYLFTLKFTPMLAQVSFILLATVMIFSKVYSPQYVLWLAPLAAIALRDRRDIHAFWIWQFGEMIYHVAIWQHLALVTGAKFGLPLGAYALISLVRIATCTYLIVRLATRPPRVNIPSQTGDFLFEAAKSYP